MNVIVPVLFQTVPATNVILPEMNNCGPEPVANVTVPVEVVIFKQFNIPVIVTVYVPTWSKNTESEGVGTLAPLDPPELVLQLVVLDEFQVPVPPTQYLFAIFYYSVGVVSGSAAGSSAGASVGIALMIANQLSNLSCLIESIVELAVLAYSSSDIHIASRYV